MTKRRGAGTNKSSDSGATNHAPFTPEKAAGVICRSIRSNEYWIPSKTLAKCLGVSYERLLVVPTPKDDISNLIWTSVLVLVYCATHLVDLHESWYEVGDAATAWLRRQPHFVNQREDLVHSASMLLDVGDPDQLLTTLFALATDAHDPGAAEEALALLREGWQRCFLNEPPYTAYYWNAETNQSTWRHPLETAQLERELREKAEKRQALLAKILPLRLPINRAVSLPNETQFCCECTARGAKQVADVLCLECGKKYFCNACCDAIHCHRTKRSHLATGLRFRECFGRSGFPKREIKPQTPFMIYQEELQRQQQEKANQSSLETEEANILVLPD